jgi:hypothetical protein
MVAPRSGDELLVTALAALAAVAGLAGAAFALLRRGRPLRVGGRWFRLEPVALLGVVRPVQRAAETLARFDERFGAAVTAAAGRVLRAGTVLARFDVAFAEAVDGSGPGRALGVTAGVQAAAARVRRVQSGSLQRYYFTGVALVAGLVVLAVAVR